MKYLIIDGMFHGTGIRDEYNGGYIQLRDLNISATLIARINKWLEMYEIAHHNGYNDESSVEELDHEGIEIAKTVKEELKEVKVSYYSDAKLKKFII